MVIIMLVEPPIDHDDSAVGRVGVRLDEPAQSHAAGDMVSVPWCFDDFTLGDESRVCA